MKTTIYLIRHSKPKLFGKVYKDIYNDSEGKLIFGLMKKELNEEYING